MQLKFNFRATVPSDVVDRSCVSKEDLRISENWYYKGQDHDNLNIQQGKSKITRHLYCFWVTPQIWCTLQWCVCVWFVAWWVELQSEATHQRFSIKFYQDLQSMHVGNLMFPALLQDGDWPKAEGRGDQVNSPAEQGQGWCCEERSVSQRGPASYYTTKR